MASISFIIPVLNEQRLIMRLLEQFTPERRKRYGIEVIVSDGGSTDGTQDIIAQAYSQGLVSVIVHHTDTTRRQTIAEGRNVGAQRATAPILVFINADTLPQNLDALCHSILTWAHSPATQSSPAAATPVHIAPEERRCSDSIFHTSMNFYVRLLNAIGIGMGRGECHIIRRTAFEAVGGYNPNIVAGEDFDLYRRLRQYGKIAWLPQALVYESPRRFRKYGYMRIMWRWSLNALSVFIFGHSVSKEWELIRE
ncbi:MAG: glycosyltransferase [Bacteroidota bacterium]|nr:glycosyltransferase [Bacteroidota bacterium]